jgi:hypothetical protein
LQNLTAVVQALPDVSKALGKSWRRWSAPGGWVLIGGGPIGLLFWNGRLVIATGIGVATMLLVYVLQDSKWNPRKDLQKWLKGWNAPFLMAAASGGAAMFGTYLAASIWAESEHHWMATGMILQGTATLGVLGLLIWKMMTEQRDRATLQLDQILNHLTQPDALKRLIAVRQLTEYIEQTQNRKSQVYLADYLRVMLAREEDEIVRDAILAGLQTLDDAHSLLPARLQPLQVSPAKTRLKPIPTALQPKQDRMTV